MEQTLRLHQHKPGSLIGQADYLHARTGGMIGSLTHLIRGAAIRAILGGQEALTRALLDTVRIDHAADVHVVNPRIEDTLFGIFVVNGDHCVVEIQGIGRLENPVVAEA